MAILKRSGSSIVEFVLMLSLLTGIGILIMWQMTYKGGDAGDAIGSVSSTAIKAIQND